MRRGLAVLLLLSLSSCSLLFQDSVRSSGVYCSTSRFWYISDFLVAGAYTYLVAVNDGVAPAYIPGAALAGSGLIGVWKRGNCVRHRATASPEMWAADAERERRKDEARAAAMRDMSAQMQQPDSSSVPPAGSDAVPPPNYSTSSTQSSTSSNVTLSVERHSATDELGKSCNSPNNTDRDMPTAGTCQYGAVCYQGRCTVWCGGDGACPSGLRCGWTDGATKVQVCR